VTILQDAPPTVKPIAATPRVGRRRLLVAATAVGLCGVGAVAAPKLLPLAEQRLQQAALAAAQGELRQLEGVSLDAAIETAELTRAAVNVIVFPVARLVAALGSGALGVLLGTLDAAHNALAFVHAPTDTVDQLRAVIASWQRGVTSLPIALDAYANADIAAAETYLKALRHKLAQGQST
jgi:hypothetical protein